MLALTAEKINDIARAMRRPIPTLPRALTAEPIIFCVSPSVGENFAHCKKISAPDIANALSRTKPYPRIRFSHLTFIDENPVSTCLSEQVIQAAAG